MDHIRLGHPHSLPQGELLDRSIFTPLAQVGLTTLKLQHNRRTDERALFTAREWDEDLDYSRYNRDFNAHTSLTATPLSLGTEEVRFLFVAHGLSVHLAEILDLLRQGRHEGIEMYSHHGKNIRFMCHQHN